jgi:hypothetical protein
MQLINCETKEIKESWEVFSAFQDPRVEAVSRILCEEQRNPEEFEPGCFFPDKDKDEGWYQITLPNGDTAIFAWLCFAHTAVKVLQACG